MKMYKPISSIMTTTVISLKTKDTLEIAEALFKENNIRHIPVVGGSKVIGMLSYNDLLRISFADAVGYDEQDVDTVVYKMFSIEQVMTKNVVTVNATNTIKEVAEIFSKREFHALPVVDDGRLVGIITTTDLINFLLEQF